MITIPDINIVIGDLHFGRYSNDLKELEISLNYFKKFIIPILQKLNKTYGAENVGIIQVGDVYDNRSLISTEIQDSILDIFEKLSEKNIVVVDTGNHDKFNNVITTNRVLSYINNCIIVKQPTRFLTKSGKTISIIPAIEKKDELTEVIANDEPADYMFGHDDIAGFYHEGIVVTEEKSINISHFSKYKYVVLGHIHKPQTNKNITYVGSAYHTRKNEWENKPQIMIIDISNESHRFVENNVSPKYLNIYLPDLLEMTVLDANNLIKNNRVSIFVDDFNKINTIKITEFLTGYYSLKYEQKVGKIYSQNESSNNNENIEYNINDDIKDVISEYVNTLDSVIIDKRLIQISDQTKDKILNNLNKLYDISKDNVKMLDI